MMKLPELPTLHLMTDIESMSTEPNAAVVSIGAVKFDPYGTNGFTEENKFYVAIGLESNEKYGRHISGGTVAWWMRQSKDAQNAYLDAHQTPLPIALNEFTRWLTSDPVTDVVWANSPSFDLVILEQAAKACGIIWPIRFWNTRDVRTITKAAWGDAWKAPKPSDGTHHNALDDSIHQAIIVQEAYAALRSPLSQ